MMDELSALSEFPQQLDSIDYAYISVYEVAQPSQCKERETIYCTHCQFWDDLAKYAWTYVVNNNGLHAPAGVKRNYQ